MENIITFFKEWYMVILAVLGVAQLVAARTPNTNDNKVVQFLLDVVNFLGGNYAKAKNK